MEYFEKMIISWIYNIFVLRKDKQMHSQIIDCGTEKSNKNRN